MPPNMFTQVSGVNKFTSVHIFPKSTSNAYIFSCANILHVNIVSVSIFLWMSFCCYLLCQVFKRGNLTLVLFCICILPDNVMQGVGI